MIGKLMRTIMSSIEVSSAETCSFFTFSKDY